VRVESREAIQRLHAQAVQCDDVGPRAACSVCDPLWVAGTLLYRGRSWLRREGPAWYIVTKAVQAEAGAEVGRR